MPIETLSRRLRELGRIRLGATETFTYESGKRKGEEGTRPVKLDRFRFTSADEQLIRAAAALYGGTPQPWDGGQGAQWEVLTDARDLPVQLPPVDGFSQWLEMWSGGGCVRRCDGVQETLSGGPCVCPADLDQRNDLASRGEACKPTTRISVILPALPGLGVWRLETHGAYAAEEIAGVADLLAAARRNRVVMPARLGVTEREQRTPGQPIKRFVVPHIDVPVPLGMVLDSIGAGVAHHQLAPGAATALGGGDLDRRSTAARPAAPAQLMQRVVIRCREVGLDDEGRHDVAHLVSDGVTSSTRGLTRGEADQALAVCDLIHGGHAHLVHDGPYGAPILLRADSTVVTFPMSLDKVRRLLADHKPQEVPS